MSKKEAGGKFEMSGEEREAFKTLIRELIKEIADEDRKRRRQVMK